MKDATRKPLFCEAPSCANAVTWYSNIAGQYLCTTHYNEQIEVYKAQTKPKDSDSDAQRRFMDCFGPCDDVVSEPRPMRPWRWDAVAFKAVQCQPRLPYEDYFQLLLSSQPQPTPTSIDGAASQYARQFRPRIASAPRGFFDQIYRWFLG